MNISLEALPNTISALPNLMSFMMLRCSSISKLPRLFGYMTCRLIGLFKDLVFKWQANSIGQFNALEFLSVEGVTNEGIISLDSLAIVVPYLEM